jgi:hypothetical protein
MNPILRQLLIASAIGVASVGAQAQTTSTVPATPSTPKVSQALSDYEAAKAACDAKTGAAKSTCMRNAKDDYERELAAPGGIGGGTMGGGHGGGTVANPKTNKS